MANEIEESCIIVAEDDVFARTMLVSFLARRGYLTTEAVSNGYELEKILATKKASLVISDNFMPPGPTDSEVFESLHEDRLGNLNIGTPFIFLSANFGIEERLIALGASAFLSKPINIELFFNSVNTALGL